MSDNEQELQQAIQLLQSLIRNSPAKPSNRVRLLSLLYVHGRKIDFLIEAQQYKENCDLTFDTDWSRICDMGRDLDPRNSFYGSPAPEFRERERHGQAPDPANNSFGSPGPESLDDIKQDPASSRDSAVQSSGETKLEPYDGKNGATGPQRSSQWRSPKGYFRMVWIGKKAISPTSEDPSPA